MNSDAITGSLVRYVTERAAATGAPAALDGFEIRTHDSSEVLEGPPVIVINCTGCRPRVRSAVNLFDADISVTMRANAADESGDVEDFAAVWTWLSGLFFPAIALRDAINAYSPELHCFTLMATPADAAPNNDDNERARTLTCTGVFILN